MAWDEGGTTVNRIMRSIVAAGLDEEETGVDDDDDAFKIELYYRQ